MCVIRPSTIAPAFMSVFLSATFAFAPASAICANDEKSSPAQNEAPSPERTTTRRPSSFLRYSPAAFNDVNIALSSALRLSARFILTSAMPSTTEIVTRSSITPGTSTRCTALIIYPFAKSCISIVAWHTRRHATEPFLRRSPYIHP